MAKKSSIDEYNGLAAAERNKWNVLLDFIVQHAELKDLQEAGKRHPAIQENSEIWDLAIDTRVSFSEGQIRRLIFNNTNQLQQFSDQQLTNSEMIASRKALSLGIANYWAEKIREVSRTSAQHDEITRLIEEAQTSNLFDDASPHKENAFIQSLAKAAGVNIRIDENKIITLQPTAPHGPHPMDARRFQGMQDIPNKDDTETKMIDANTLQVGENSGGILDHLRAWAANWASQIAEEKSKTLSDAIAPLKAIVEAEQGKARP